MERIRGKEFTSLEKFMTNEKKLILIDSNALLHRAYHALPPLADRKGEVVNAVYGFLLVLFKVLKEMKPDYVICSFDLPGPTFRDKEYAEYKAGRVKPPDEFYKQIPVVKDILNVFKIPIIEKQGFEADDIIGTMTKKSLEEIPTIKNIIVSGDLDTLQLVNHSTIVYTLRKGIKDTIIYDKEKVIQRYGLEPKQLANFKGLRGDPSDNIPGVPGIGEKTAALILKEFGTLENLYQKVEAENFSSEKFPFLRPKIIEKILEYKDQAFFSKFLGTIKCDVPLDFKLKENPWGTFDIGEISKVFEKFNFYSLLKRLPEIKESFPDSKNQNQKNIQPSLLK